MKPDYWEKARKYLITSDRVLGKIISQYKGESLTVRGDAFYTLARSIIGQQISVKAADSVWQKFESCLQQIIPQNLLIKNEDELRNCGLSSQKIRYLNGLSEYFIDNEERVKNWHALPDDEIITELTQISGIGRWTAEMFLIFHLSRPDVLPLADIGLQKAIFRHYNNEQKMPLSEIFELSQKWKPYRSVATWYLWRSLDPVPVAY